MMQRSSRKNLTFANLLTVFRLVLIPFVSIAILYHAWCLALCLFVIAAVTDFLDGAFARLFDEQTNVGAYLDPIADKGLILSCYITLLMSGVPSTIVPVWLVISVLIKEVMLVAGTLYFGLVRRTITVRPSWLGKAAMLAQTIWVFWLLLVLFAGWSHLGTLTLFHKIVFGLVVASGVHYSFIFLKGTQLWYCVKKALCS